VWRGPSSPALFRLAHLLFVHAEVVRDLVPDGFLHQLFQVLGAARHPFMRPLEDGDAVRHGEALENAARGERPALIEAQQRTASRHGRRLRLHHQRHVLHAHAEARGNTGKGALYDAVEFGGSHNEASIAFLLLFYVLSHGNNTRRVIVAIDGPAGAGKSTIARRLAARLGFTYIDTGAMYRAVGLWALRQSLDVTDMHHREQLARAAAIELLPDSKIRLNSEDVTDAIRTPEVSDAASKVSVIAAVRRELVEKQRALAETTSVVMEGRDIGTVVFPQADVKIFLDADPRERARRRHLEKPKEGSVEQVAREMRERDQRDRTRAEAPLTQAPDAVYIDSTGLTLDEVEEAILKVIRARVSNGKEFRG
jgi:CMP/dCMP kinase